VVWPGSAPTIRDTWVGNHRYGLAVDAAAASLDNVTFSGNRVAILLDASTRRREL
jgi:hypothetical protein